MICANCGKEINENSRFCGVCGAPVAGQPVYAQPAVPPAKAGKKKGRAGVIVLIVALVVLLAGGAAAGAFLFWNRPVNRINRALEKNDLAAVAELYPQLSSDKDREEISARLLEYAEVRRDAYLGEEADYETVYDELLEIASADSKEDGQIEEILELLTEIKASRDSYAAAEQYRADGSYEMALAAYAGVIPEDTAYYDMAQEAMEATRDELVQASLSSAYSCRDSGDYAQAQQILEDALLVVPGSSELTEAVNDIQAAQQDSRISAAIEEANAAVAEGRISDARSILEDILEEYPDSTQLQDAIAGLPADGTLTGLWKMEYDVSQEIVADMGDEFDDFRTPLVIPLMFEFNEDGTFRMYVGEEFKENLDTWMDEFIRYSTDMLYDMLSDMGLSKKQADAMIEEQFGVSLEDYIRQEAEDAMDTGDIEELIATEESGYYEARGDRLYISDEYGEWDEDSYEIFQVEGDTLTFMLPEGMESEEILPGLNYPFTLTRETETN